MQKRMKMNQMNKEEIVKIMESAPIGVFSSVGTDGYPYGAPVQFVYYEEKIYFHGLAVGEKLDNIKVDEKVCFTVYEMGDVWHPEDMQYMCGIETEYKSVIARGKATVVQDERKKEDVLIRLVGKYAPELVDMPMKGSSYAQTAVVEIQPKTMTGKHGDQKKS